MKKKFYLIGIGGIAMANLACLLKKRGYSVSGSDSDTFGPSAVLLKEHNIKYFKGHRPIHVQKFKPDIAVIGNAIQRGNPALEYVLDKQIPCRSMPEIVREEIIKNKTSVVVAGTSGKTTTAALLAWILKGAGLKPAAFIGGIMKNTGRGFMAGPRSAGRVSPEALAAAQGFGEASNGKYVVVEGDEHSSSFFDSSPKFLHYRPYHAIINNIQADHLDIYGDLENIFKAFQKLIGIIPRAGSLILNNANQYTNAAKKNSRSRIITFGKNGDIWANGIKPTEDGLSFVVFNGARRLGEIKSRLLGKHNVENMLAAIALALRIRVPFKKIAQAVTKFKGVKRRLEIICQKNSTIIIDDFAHNPDKVFASLSALRSHFPKHQIIAVFEPRTGSSRRKFFQNAYISSFKPADLAYIAEPYKKSVLDKKEVFSSWRLAKDLNKNNTEAYALKNADHIIAHLRKSFARISRKPTIITVMTSGEFDGIHRKLVKLVEQQGR